MEHDPEKPDAMLPTKVPGKTRSNGMTSPTDNLSIRGEMSLSRDREPIEGESTGALAAFQRVPSQTSGAEAIEAEVGRRVPSTEHQNASSAEIAVLAGQTRLHVTAIEPSDDKSAIDVSLDSGKRLRQPDPVTQSLMLLATIALMLAAARFVVPSVVEEIRYAWHRGELRAEYESGTEGLRNVSLDALSEAYQMVTSAVGPSVVHIDIQRRPTMQDDMMSGMRSSSIFPATDQGSGIVVDKDGYILTNRHVITDGEDIHVTLSDGRRVAAVVIGTDPLTDLAVLKIDADGLMPIAWGDSDRCRVGSPVWAVGSPFGLDRTVTFGILSGKHRMVRASTQYQDFMQSDVAVNPGNSGGPLVDARGTLVGINTAIVGDTYQGVSFSIPSNVARQVYDRLRETGRVDRAWLGVALLEVEEENLVGDDRRVRGAMVSKLTNSNSPAAVAGLKMGDHILTVDETPVRDLGHLMRMIGDSRAGSEVTLDILRGDEALSLKVTLGSRPGALANR